MKKKTAVILSLLLLLSLGFSSCKKAEEDAAPISYEGFETSARLTGGSEVAEANIKSLAFSEQDGDTRISIGFLSGSRLSGGASEAAAAQPPAYAAYMLKNPARLILEFSNVSYWDYTRGFAPPDMAFLFGCFQTRFTGDAALRLTFQLTSDAVYQVNEVTGGLELVLRPIAAPAESDDGAVQVVGAGQRFYAVADAYRDYCNGVLPRDGGVAPALAQNKTDILMLSAAFYSEADAKSFLSSFLLKNEGAVEAKWKVSMFGENEAPEYDAEQAYASARALEVMRVNGAPASAEVFIEDGLFLCVTPDKKGSLYSKRLVGGQPGVDEYIYEKIYCREAGGVSKPYLDAEFQVVEQVRFSPDGRKLAVLERDEERTHLYVYDADARELLTDLTEVGFGSLVSAFTWDSLGLSIFAVSGSGAMQVHQYDFGVPEESKRHSVVDKNGADEGYIAYCGGELYFTESELETGEVIYRVKPDGGVRKAFTQGGAFSISPDGRYMALSITGMGTGSAPAGFYLYHMETGETKTVTNAFTVSSFVWSWDGSRLFYTQNRLAGEGGEGATSGGEGETDTPAPTEEPADPYPYTLWMYDAATGQSTELMDLFYPVVAVSNKAGQVLFNYYDAETGGEVIRATYLLPAGE